MDYCRREVNVLKKNITIKFGEMIASLALIVTVLNVNSTCCFFVHQPKLPNGIEKIRKFK